MIRTANNCPHLQVCFKHKQCPPLVFIVFCVHADSGVSIEWLRLLEKSLRDYPRPFVDTADVVKCLLQAARTEYPSCTLLDLIPTGVFVTSRQHV